jgi:hypothetical protein
MVLPDKLSESLLDLHNDSTTVSIILAPATAAHAKDLAE